MSKDETSCSEKLSRISPIVEMTGIRTFSDNYYLLVIRYYLVLLWHDLFEKMFEGAGYATERKLNFE
jgi:hypothetical protein